MSFEAFMGQVNCLIICWQVIAKKIHFVPLFYSRGFDSKFLSVDLKYPYSLVHEKVCFCLTDACRFESFWASASFSSLLMTLLLRLSNSFLNLAWCSSKGNVFFFSSKYCFFQLSRAEKPFFFLQFCAVLKYRVYM